MQLPEKTSEYDKVPAEAYCGSHQYALTRYATAALWAHGTVIEAGMGYGSSPLLAALVHTLGRGRVYAFDSHPDWCARFKHLEGRGYECHVRDPMEFDPAPLMPKLVFVDCAPAKTRVALINRLAACPATVVLVHDVYAGKDAAVYGWGYDGDCFDAFASRRLYADVWPPTLALCQDAALL